MNKKRASSWAPITDLPNNWDELANKELPSLADVWREQAERLKQSKALADFTQRLCREWAIETGIIERLYDLDTGITELLIHHGLDGTLISHGMTDQDPEYVMDLIQDQHTAVEGLFDFVKSQRKLTTSYIKEVHQLFTRHQDATTAMDQFGNVIKVDLLRGEWKKLPNNPKRPDGTVHEYCPPEQVGSEMDRLIEMHLRHSEDQIPPEIEASWLHHKFSQIHPFQDGNGRVARGLATLIFLRAGWFPLVIRRTVRDRYIRALEYADAGDLSHLINEFSKIEKEAFVQALGLSREVLHDRADIAEIVHAAGALLAERKQERERRMARVFDYADELMQIAQNSLRETAELLSNTLREVQEDFTAFVSAAGNGDPRDHYYRYQIVEAAKQQHYFANPQTYRSWALLTIVGAPATSLLLCFHCLGQEFNGVMVCSALIFSREEAGQESTEIADIKALGESPFQFNYNDQPAILKTRFDQWVQEVLVVGLDRWRRSL